MELLSSHWFLLIISFALIGHLIFILFHFFSFTKSAQYDLATAAVPGHNFVQFTATVVALIKTRHCFPLGIVADLSWGSSHMALNLCEVQSPWIKSSVSSIHTKFSRNIISLDYKRVCRNILSKSGLPTVQQSLLAFYVPTDISIMNPSLSVRILHWIPCSAFLNFLPCLPRRRLSLQNKKGRASAVCWLSLEDFTAFSGTGISFDSEAQLIVYPCLVKKKTAVCIFIALAF